MAWRYELWSTLFVFIVSILAIIMAFMSIWIISIMFLPLLLYSGWYLIKMIKNKTTMVEEPIKPQQQYTDELFAQMKKENLRVKKLQRRKKLEKLNTI